MNDFPRRISLELTNRCNFNCMFCPRKYMEAERGDLDPALATAALEEMATRLPVTLVPFFRGESLLHPQWSLILEKACALGVGPIQLATNASLLTEARARRMLELPLQILSFSMDTIDPEKYKRFRGGDYHESLANVLRFLEWRSKCNNPIQVQVSAVENAENKDEIEAFVAFWSPKVDRVRIYAEHSGDGAPGSLADPPLPRAARRLCHKVMEDMVICWNGDVALCNHDWTRRVTGQFIGNIGDGGIAKIWNGPAYERIRTAHEKGDVSGIAPCESCDHWAVRYIPEGYWGRVFSSTESER